MGNGWRPVKQVLARQGCADYAIVDAEGYVIGEAYRKVGNGAMRDARAHARLWSASDGLLECCERAKEVLSAAPSGDLTIDAATRGELLAQLRKAIERAVGKER